MIQLKKPLATALSAAFLATSIAPLASAATNPFSAQQLSGGYDLASYDKSAEGNCGGKKAGGEGSCGDKAKGEGSCGDKAKGEGKCGDKAKGEGKCGDKAKAKVDDVKAKAKEAKCGEGKCGEGKCGGDKAKEAKCGEGKCGEKH
jgi:uncharacterized low-complexity protein